MELKINLLIIAVLGSLLIEFPCTVARNHHLLRKGIQLSGHRHRASRSAASLNSLDNDGSMLIAKSTTSVGIPGPVGLNNSVTAVKPGDSAKLACPVPAELFGTKVSWIRRRDLELLAVGENMYSNDPRFFVSHSRHSHYQGARHSQVWFLHLLNVTLSDEGEYECQLSTHPHTSTIVHLTVADAYSEIMGAPERGVAAGSSLRLECYLRNTSSPHSFVFWYQGPRMVNFDNERNVKVIEGKDFSILTVTSVTEDHAGKYTCEPSNASPSSVQVHVVQDTENSGSSTSGGPNGSAKKIGDSGESKTPVRQLGVKSANSAKSVESFCSVLSIAIALSIYFIDIYSIDFKFGLKTQKHNGLVRRSSRCRYLGKYQSRIKDLSEFRKIQGRDICSDNF